jgi:predicted dehydrogenase
MRTKKNIAAIGCQMSEEFFLASGAHGEELMLKKAFYGVGSAPASFKTQFPETEIVEDILSIAHDPSIELIVVSTDHLLYAREAIAAGKPIRII